MDSRQMFKKAKQCIPGGVNSPVRAYKAVGLTPPFIKKALGSKIYDIDGNEYIDYVCSWGPMILGHSDPYVLECIKEALNEGLSFGAPTPREVALAEEICSAAKGVEMVRLVSSGTEAVMSALRLARGFTGKKYIIKFDGCYHGHSDSMLVKAGSGLATAGIPDSAGVPDDIAGITLTANYNDIDSVKALFREFDHHIAGVIIEPVAGNMGLVNPDIQFLTFLRQITKAYNSVLIFDEVISGFRLSYGGAAQFYGITPDISTFGKILGGGMPIGAYGGRRDIMEQVAPIGPVYQAGTLSGNPIATAAGLATLHTLRQNPDIYIKLSHNVDTLTEAAKSAAKKHGINIKINKNGSLFTIFFADIDITDYQKAKTSDTTLFALYFREMLKRGIYLPPSQFETVFMSAAHSDEDIYKTAEAISEAFSVVAALR